MPVEKPPAVAQLPFIADRRSALDATRLVDDYGVHAAAAAAAHATRSRDLGNVVSFCRWRQVERLIVVLNDVGGAYTRH